MANSALEAVHGAAWVIDLASGRIVAATKAGKRLFDPGAEQRSRHHDERGRPGILLDAAMPALAHLREIPHPNVTRRVGAAAEREPRAEIKSGEALERLVFWRPQGRLILRSRVTSICTERRILAAVEGVEENSEPPSSRLAEKAPLVEAAPHALHAHLAPRLPRVVVDAASLRQIVRNLLTNALKFTGGGGRKIIATRCVTDGPLSIEIADTRRGMSRSDIARYLDDRILRASPCANN